jgi:hypothetical protein
MKKTTRIFAAAVLGLSSLFSTLAHADAEEDNKLVSTIQVNSDGGFTLVLQSPSSTLTSNCYLGIIGVHSTDAAAKQWLSQLIAAKASQTSISVYWTGGSGACYLSWIRS